MNHVPNAMAGRDNIEIEIFGMEGIPEEDRIAHERAKSGKSVSGLVCVCVICYWGGNYGTVMWDAQMCEVRLVTVSLTALAFHSTPVTVS